MVSRNDESMQTVKPVVLQAQVLALMFTESSTAALGADNNQVTHTIKCTIYGNMSLALNTHVRSKTEAKHKHIVCITFVCLEGGGEITSPVKTCFPICHVIPRAVYVCGSECMCVCAHNCV